MKIHEIIDSIPPAQRGPSLTESKAEPAGEAGKAILLDAASRTHSQARDSTRPKTRLREFLRLQASRQIKG